MVASVVFGFPAAAACPRALVLVPDAVLAEASTLAALGSFRSGELFTEGFLMTLFFARAVDMGPPYFFFTSPKDIALSAVHLIGKRLNPAAASSTINISDCTYARACVSVSEQRGSGRTYGTSPSQNLQCRLGRCVGRSK